MMISMRIAGLLALACACSGAAEKPEELPPPPPVKASPYPLVGKTAAVTPIEKLSRPTSIVWIGATGTIELAHPDKAWTGALPASRTPIASVDALAAEIAPRVIEPAPGDPWSTPDVAPVTARGYERVPAAVGARAADGAVPLVLASPAVTAASVVEIATSLGAQLAVSQKGDRVAVLRLTFRPATTAYVLDDTREHWVELHLGADRIDVIALPSNGRAIVPWTKTGIDLEALRAIYKGYGKEAPTLDVFVDPAVTYQHLIDALVALDDLGVTVLGLAKTPGAIDQRVAQIAALRAARASYSTPTAVLEGGRVQSQGDLDKREILRVLRTKYADFITCYEPVLAKQPELRGQVSMQFFITPHGTVATATANGMPEVAPCVAEKLRRVEFPAPKGGGGVQANFNVRFRPVVR